MKTLALPCAKLGILLTLILNIQLPNPIWASQNNPVEKSTAQVNSEGFMKEKLLTSQLIYFWLFDTSIPNDTPLETIDPVYGLIEGGLLSYHSALAGYPFDPEDPNWRKASMERRNAPTPINYRPEGNNGIPYENSEMRGIQIKQPFTGDGGQNTILFNLPTTDFKDVIFRFAAMDEDAADNLVIDYSVVSGDPLWVNTGLTNPTPALEDDYELFEIDFSQATAANNNPDFKIRIRFSGSNMSGDEGNRVNFNNFSLDATSISGGNLPPVVVNQLPLQELIEAGESLVFNLNNVFNDPDNDPLTFTASSSRPTMVQAILNGSTLTLNPIKRGDAIISLTASDGNYPPVNASFRVLVYPMAFPLSNGQFSFTAWNPNEPEYTYPQHMIFLQSDINDPGLNDPLLFPYFIPHDDYHPDDIATIGFPYNNTRRTRINGLGDEGISFINTGRERDLGGALLALDTRNVSDATLEWLGGTILKNERVYAIRLLYRTDLFSPFTDLIQNSQIIEYMTAEDGDEVIFDNIHLPLNALNKQYVQLLWKYYFVEVETGARAQLRLDDIIFKDITGVKDFEQDLIHVHTVGGSIFVNYPELTNGLLTVHDVMGRLIEQKQLHNSSGCVINLNQAHGVFIIRILTGDNIWSKKVLIR
ncbi:MAG: T9SS type A sorting domain-containing protein [Bacteroidales bacterium]|nr:T9SS type A sorting domain-containing protein [Bacteroidales bacterium]